MIPTRTSLDIHKEHEIFRVQQELERRFHVTCEIEEPQDPEYVTREIGMWFLDVLFDIEGTDFEVCYVVFRAHEGWEVKLGENPPPGADRDASEILNPETWEGVVEAIATYLTDNRHMEDRDADHQP